MAPVALNEDFTGRSKVEDLGRWHITEFIRTVAASLPPGTRLLDAGAGECAYKKYFGHCRYIAMDLAVGESAWNYANLDCFARLDRLPVPDGSLDAVLCTQVLEHLEWPRECARDFFRVLKPGGALYLTAPMSQGEHQAPHDFFRYTSFGLRSICAGAGFRSVQIAPLGGLPGRISYELPRLLALFPGSGIKSGRIKVAGLLLLPARAVAFLLVRLLQALLIWADRFDRARNDPYGWAVTARK